MVFFKILLVCFLFLSKRYLLHDLIQLNIFRQKDIISEIYRDVYPIINDTKKEYSIGNVKLPQAEDKIYQTSLS